MSRLFLLTLVLILYASLFPWRFHPLAPGVNPAELVWNSWTMHRPFSSILSDVSVNVIAYIPLGLFGYLTFNPAASETAAGLAAILSGFGLSLLVELTQAFVPGRNPNALDVTSNTVGAALGVVVALLWTKFPHPHSKHPDVLSLISCWTAAALLPFISRWTHPGLIFTWRPLDMLQDFAASVTLAALIHRLPVPRGHRLGILAALMAVVPLRALFIAHSVTVGAVAAVTAGYLVAAFLPLRPAPVLALLAVAIAAHGLLPFHFLPFPRKFNWQPFGSTIASEPESGVAILFAKMFLYGSIIWLLRELHVRLPIAAVITAAFLASIEAIQRWQPVHSPEITDPLLALIMAWLLWSLQADVAARAPSLGNLQHARPPF